MQSPRFSNRRSSLGPYDPTSKTLFPDKERTSSSLMTSSDSASLSTPVSRSSPARKRRMSSDRFIPMRQIEGELQVAKYQLHHGSPKSQLAASPCASPTKKVNLPTPTLPQEKNPIDTTPSHEEYKALLGQRLFGPASPSRTKRDDLMQIESSTPFLPSKRILPFSSSQGSATKYKADPQSPIRVTSESSGLLRTPQPPRSKPSRDIPNEPFMTLDAPDLEDDYYLNLLDWSADNILVLALGPTVYLWNANTFKTQGLTTLPSCNIVTSVSFVKSDRSGSAQTGAPTAPYVAVGTSEAEIEIWDIEKNKKIRTITGHTNRVGSLDWCPGGQSVLSSGSRDGLILSHDIRSASNEPIHSLQNHRQEVCGLKWSRDGTSLASGGNDNLLNIWDISTQSCRFSFDHHIAAVKALAWCPWQDNLLASGGGTADRTIRFWNTSTGACINSLDTQSQVCALQWSKNYKELVSSHGYSKTALVVWKYPKMKKITELKGHTSRVLHMVESPDGTTVASCAKDDTLRLWKIWDVQKSTPATSPNFKLRVLR